MQEEWRRISLEGFQHYRINRNGTIVDECWQRIRCKMGTRRMMADIRDASGKRRSLNLAKLVLLTFLGSSPGREWVVYIDGNKRNCSYSNLAWASLEEIIALSKEQAAKCGH